MLKILFIVLDATLVSCLQGVRKDMINEDGSCLPTADDIEENTSEFADDSSGNYD